MHHYEYFSYDFFDKGLFGLKSFFAIMVFSILIIAVFFFGFLIPLGELVLKKRCPKISEYLPYVCFMVASWSLLVFLIYQEEINSFRDIFYLLGVSLLVMTHIVMLFYAQPKFQFLSLILVAMIFTLLTISFRESVAKGVNTALTSFGIGGFQCVTVSDSTSSYKIDGRLILASPDYIYVQKADDKDAVTYIRVDSNTIYSVGEQYCISQPAEAELRDEDEESIESSEVSKATAHASS